MGTKTALTAKIRRRLHKEAGRLRLYANIVYQLVRRDFVKKYRRSVLGILWSMLSPLISGLLFGVVFNAILKSKVDNFLIYYIAGSTIFGFMTSGTSACAEAITRQAQLISNLPVPKSSFVVENIVFALTNTLFSFVTLLLIMLAVGAAFHLSVLLFWIPLVYMFVFSLGLGFVIATLNVFFRDVQYLYPIFTRMLLYITPVLYSMDNLGKTLTTIISINPMTYYIVMFRDLVVSGIYPDLRSHLICASTSVIVLLIGLLIFRSKRHKFILYI